MEVDMRTRRTLAMSLLGTALTAWVGVGVANGYASPASTGAGCVNVAAAPAEVLSPEQSVSRVAANITAGRGKPTAAGRTFLQTRSSTSVASAVRSLAEDDEYVVDSTIVSTEAQPPAAAAEPSAGLAALRRATSRSKLLSVTRPARAAGATITYFNCGLGFQANLIWYCRPGSSCTTRWYFWLHGAIGRTSYCSIVSRYSCQVYATANPPSYDAVTYATMTQSMPGVPVVGDKWCSWG
jgi:hypothetical protein